MSTPLSTSDVDEIRRQMAQIRRELHEDVQGVVASAEAATDWRRYLTAYPWLSLSAAFALGYLVVPKRHRPAVTHSDLSQVRQAVEETREGLVQAVRGQAAEPAPPRKRGWGRGLIGGAFGLLGPLALRAGQSYALSFLENWIAQQQNQHQGGPPGPGARPTPAASPWESFPGAGTGPSAGQVPPRPGAGPR